MKRLTGLVCDLVQRSFDNGEVPEVWRRVYMVQIILDMCVFKLQARGIRQSQKYSHLFTLCDTFKIM